MIGFIAFLATLLVLALLGFGKRHRKAAAKPKKRPAMSQQETDELITVILPTINHDK